jgi:hypothetical protein
MVPYGANNIPIGIQFVNLSSYRAPLVALMVPNEAQAVPIGILLANLCSYVARLGA